MAIILVAVSVPLSEQPLTGVESSLYGWFRPVSSASLLSVFAEQSAEQTPETISTQMISRSEEQLEEAQSNLTGFLLFNDKSYGVHIRYPMSWQVLEGDRNNFDGIIDIVRFLSPIENDSDVYQERLRLS